MKENQEEEKSGIEKAGEDLFTFATDREDVKALMAVLPEDAQVKRETVEYELQILKIISAGWSITYFLEQSPCKEQLAEHYWKAVYEYAKSLSETTALMIGQDIDYFQIVKDRLDVYIQAMQKKTDAPEPAVIIGPEFAQACGNKDEVFAVMTGSRMFKATVGSVKEYLEHVRLM